MTPTPEQALKEPKAEGTDVAARNLTPITVALEAAPPGPQGPYECG